MPDRLKTRAAFKAVARGARAYARDPDAPRLDRRSDEAADGAPKLSAQQRGGGAAKRRGGAPANELFTLQARTRPAPDDKGAARVGFTVTKKVGNAVVRNRIKRRLRAASEDTADAFADGTDYVVVARRGVLDAPFALLRRELGATLGHVHAKLRRTRAGSDPVPAASDAGSDIMPVPRGSGHS